MTCQSNVQSDHWRALLTCVWPLRWARGDHTSPLTAALTLLPPSPLHLTLTLWQPCPAPSHLLLLVNQCRSSNPRPCSRGSRRCGEGVLLRSVYCFPRWAERRGVSRVLAGDQCREGAEEHRILCMLGLDHNALTSIVSFNLPCFQTTRTLYHWIPYSTQFTKFLFYLRQRQENNVLKVW